MSSVPTVKIPCTVGVLTRNSADVLERLLDATERFAERVVCDGGSVDGTVELAQSRGCVVIQQDRSLLRPDGTLRNFGGAMDQLLDATTQPWFFKIDSDEVPSAELVDELDATLRQEVGADALTVALKYVVGGVEIEAASTYPMRQARVVRKDAGIRFTGSVHESLCLGERPVKDLGGSLLLPQWPVRVLIRRWWRYLRIEADAVAAEPLPVRWRPHAVKHLRAVRHLALRSLAIRLAGAKPRLPARYELLRLANHLTAALVLVAPRSRRRAR